MGLLIREMYVMAVNSDTKPHRIHHRLFPTGFMDIPPISECPGGVSLPAAVFKRNCNKDWLWRMGCEPKSKEVPIEDLSMRELRARAKALGISIKVGMTKAHAVELIKRGG
jgi:hypothetical protein